MSINGVGSNYINSSASQSLNRSQESLSSGRRINSAADDAAGLQIANRLTGQIDGNGQAIRNSMDGISLAQVAQSGLESITNDLTSLRELAVQAGNGIYSSADRQALQKQASALMENIQSTIGNTTFAGKELFTENGSLGFQVGPNSNSTFNVATNDITASLTSSGLFSLDISDANALESTLSSIDDSLSNISSLQTEYGATQNAFSSRIDALLSNRENESAARSRIQDADFAATVSDQIAASILERSSIAVQAQANANAGQSLNLLSS
ncbi:flagellin N-terminal helical domain-containing protein [Marinomonas fungiae]|uniref:Flagellin n=1 Tax=Marinomonas fungiae TaxID=1137284 RepID=A0A0K6ITJ1_9GAMM|nr:flagellin [Marinomonas fungiae]CUB06423.1 Flagellin and related hook-associated protein FlgL [Marinomonas fungiae]